MNTTYILVFLLLFAPLLYAQKTAKSDTIKPAKGNVDKQLEQIKDRKTKLHSESNGNEPKKSALIDTFVQNKYGDLLDDDPEYNKKYPLWKPALEVFATNAFVLSVDRYVFRYNYASEVGLNSWKHNLKTGWEWDKGRFGINFIGHPYSGAMTYNAARSNGYNYFQSTAFSIGGSLMWEYFGENTLPSYNDIINTPISGAFLGEILYRLSSNILDDRTRGGERVIREIAAAIVDPKRAIDRILQGKTFRHTNKEVYEKEPLNISFYGGLHRINGTSQGIFGNGPNSAILNAQFDYGNPFEIRSRKPFDFFKLRTELSFNTGRKYLDNITGYAILFGKNKQVGKLAILIGGFQYYDYWDNKTFELGTIGFGGGVFSKLPLSKSSNLYTNIHLAIIPFAGNSTRFDPDTSQFRDYNFGAGGEGKFESTINLGKYATASLIFYYYVIGTYVGVPGTNFIGILKPRVTVRIYKNLSIGFEHYVYYNDRYVHNISPIHLVKTEQKIFLQLFFENSQRRGHYN
jgi:hypothetical protein